MACSCLSFPPIRDAPHSPSPYWRTQCRSCSSRCLWKGHSRRSTICSTSRSLGAEGYMSVMLVTKHLFRGFTQGSLVSASLITRRSHTIACSITAAVTALNVHESLIVCGKQLDNKQRLCPCYGAQTCIAVPSASVSTQECFDLFFDGKHSPCASICKLVGGLLQLLHVSLYKVGEYKSIRISSFCSRWAISRSAV